MKRLLTALVLIPLVLLAVFRAPDQVFIALVGMISILATTEYLQIIQSYGYAKFRLTTYSVIAALYVAVMLGTSGTAEIGLGTLLLFVPLLLFVVAPSVLLMAGMREPDMRQVLPGAAMSFFAVPYIAGSLLCLALLRNTAGGWFFILFTFFAVWVGDSAAYYVGRSIGRHKFSRISPKKTWEGAVASVLGAVAVVALFSHFVSPIQQTLARFHLVSPAGFVSRAPLWLVCLIGALINVAAQLGDLFESLIKRGAGVKDSGTILPGHGGILDRIDALLFAAPVAFVLFVVFGGKFLASM